MTPKTALKSAIGSTFDETELFHGLRRHGGRELDRCLTMAMQALDPEGCTGAFRTIIGNDERQFNGPGVRVLMLSLSRARPSGHPDWPYPRDLVLRTVDVLEANRVPVNRFQGEVFCSRYGIQIDPDTNPEGNHSLFDVMFLIDGTQSIADIAAGCGVSFESVRQTVEELARHGLAGYRDDGGRD